MIQQNILPFTITGSRNAFNESDIDSVFESIDTTIISKNILEKVRAGLLIQ